MFRKLTGMIAVCAMAMAFSAGSAAAKVCKNYEYQAQGGTVGTFAFARAKARIAWNKAVRKEIGPAWRLWINSADREYDCDSRNGREACIVRARPCRVGGGEMISSCQAKKLQRVGERVRGRKAARRSARTKWRDTVRKRHGDSWAHWNNAKVDELRCWRSKGRYRCRASARACQ